MISRSRVNHVLSAAFLLAFSAGALEGVAIAAPPNGRPNILFIMSDDHASQAVGAYGSRLAELDPTPNIGKWSRTKPNPLQNVYYPGTEELKSDEMRVIALGTGM